MSQRPNKGRTAYVCNACGAQQPKWSGQCPDCGAWNAIEETVRPVAPPGPKRGGYAGGATPAIVHRLAEVAPEAEIRSPSGIAELDRVLGGGLVQGSVVL